MDQREISITGVLSLHREGELLRPSFRSLLTALRRFNSVEAQRVIGGPALKWELVAVLDRADEETELVLREEIATHCAIERCRILKVEVGDLGLSRNEAVRGASGTFIGFLDGDDLCSRDWLVRAYSLCSSYPQRIAHPEYNLYFGREAAIFAHPRQKQYDLRALFFHNLWSALSFGPRAVYESVPYLANEISQGVGYEDWNWNCRTIDAGWTHEYVPQTCHFIRLKELSAALSAHSRNNACIIKPAGVWKSLTESGAVRDATEGAEDELSVLYRESAAERAPLFDLDPSIIDVSSLPVWLRDEAIECSEKGLPLLEKSQLFNFSPLTKNPFTDLLSGTLFEKVQRGIDAIHFVRSDLALCDIERALVIADERATVGGLAESLSLAELSPRLGEKLPLFVGMLALQSGCREVHLWDSELAGEIVSTVQRALVRYDIKLVWHQLVPGATPPDALMVGGKARSGWTLLPHCPLVSYQNAPGLPLVQDKLSVLYLVDIPREHRPWQQQCVWYRVIGPGKALEADGHRVMYLLMDDEPRWEALLQQRACDIVILHRGQSSAHFDRLRELTRQQSIPLCYDVDDNIICGAALSGASHLSNLGEARLREIDRWADSNGECMRACDAALLATAELEAVASDLLPSSYTSSNYLPDFYRLDTPLFGGKSRPHDGRVLVYYGPGSQEHSKFLETISHAIREVMEAVPEMHLILGGGLQLPSALQEVRERVTIVPRLAPQFYLNSLRHMDLVLAPLDLDRFTVCKSWIKVLEADYAGTSWLGAALPSYRRFAEHFSGGAVVEDGEWQRELRRAVEQLRSSSPSEKTLKLDHLISRHTVEYEAILRTIIEDGVPIADTVEAVESLGPDPVLQIYWSSLEGTLSEERSIRRALERNRLESIELELQVPSATWLRIDPIDQEGLVSLSEIVVRCGETGAIQFRADERGGWDRTVPSGTCRVLSRGKGLVLDCIGSDPQLNLPPIATDSGKIKVQLLLRVEAADAGDPRFARARKLRQIKSSLRRVMSRVCFFLP